MGQNDFTLKRFPIAYSFFVCSDIFFSSAIRNLLPATDCVREIAKANGFVHTKECSELLLKIEKRWWCETSFIELWCFACENPPSQRMCGNCQLISQQQNENHERKNLIIKYAHAPSTSIHEPSTEDGKKTHFIFGRKNLISSTKSNWNELRLLSHSHNLHFPRGTDESIFLGFHCIRSAVASSRVCFSPFFDYIFLRLLHGNSFANVNQDTVRLFMDLRRTEFSAPPEKMNNVPSASTSFVFAAPRFPFLYRKDYNFCAGNERGRQTEQQ